MENEEKELTQEESLRIIQNMLNEAKNDFTGDAFIFLLWGWLVFIASVAHFTLFAIYHSNAAGNVWMLMPLGGIVTIIYFIKKRKRDRTKTNVTEFLKFIWIAFTVSLLIIM